MLPADVEDFSLLPPFVSLFLSSDYGQRKVNELVEKKKNTKTGRQHLTSLKEHNLAATMNVCKGCFQPVMLQLSKESCVYQLLFTGKQDADASWSLLFPFVRTVCILRDMFIKLQVHCNDFFVSVISTPHLIESPPFAVPFLHAMGQTKSGESFQVKGVFDVPCPLLWRIMTRFPSNITPTIFFLTTVC